MARPAAPGHAGGSSFRAGHHGFMKSQQRRDEETVTIVAGLLLFLVVTDVGAVALVIAHQFLALEEELLSPSFRLRFSPLSLAQVRRPDKTPDLHARPADS